MQKKVFLGALNPVVEPIGLLHLATIAKEEGWEPKVTLAENSDLTDLDKKIDEFKPDLFGFTIYTGNHLQIFEYFDKLKKRNPNINIIFGGPHATYSPAESLRHADYVVLSEGLNGFRRILRNEVKKGIVPLEKLERFPISSREEFYKDHPKYNLSHTKSIITQTGCPFSCTYCYNSSTLSEISSILSKEQCEKMGKVLGASKRLFPITVRSVDDVVEEVANTKIVSPETSLIYFQDDVFGANLEWVKEFREKFPQTGIKFHAQMRFENADPDNPKCREKIELMREAGCTGLTFAIESADRLMRKEVLNRHMNEDLMFNVFHFLSKLGYKVRTEQMLGLPYGATSLETRVGIDQDLETLKLNIRLKEETGLPNMAWASIFIPYKGTRIYDYCVKHGFYEGNNKDVPMTFFERSVLTLPKKWIGPSLSSQTKGAWLDGAELEEQRDKIDSLRDLFTTFGLMPKGHRLAKKFLDNKDKSYKGLSTTVRRHLYDAVLYGLE